MNTKVIYANAYIYSKQITSTEIDPYHNDEFVEINGLYIISNDDVSSIPPNSSYIKISPTTGISEIVVDKITPATGSDVEVNGVVVEPGAVSVDQETGYLKNIEPWDGGGNTEIHLKGKNVIGNHTPLHQIENTITFAGTGASPTLDTVNITQIEYDTDKEELLIESMLNADSRIRFNVDSTDILTLGKSSISFGVALAFDEINEETPGNGTTINDFNIKKNTGNTSIDITVPAGYSIRFIEGSTVMMEITP